METLGHIAKSLTIGALDALQDLLSIVNTVHLTGGVSVYTVTHRNFNGYDLRSANLANNFGNGRVLRADKSQIKSTNAYVYNEEGKLALPVIYSDYIGELYHQNDEISNFNFITEDGFSVFENAIRKKNLEHIDGIYPYYNNFHENYSSDILGPDERKVVVAMNIGDEYSLDGPLNKLSGRNENILDSPNFLNKQKDYTDYVSVSIRSDYQKYMDLVPDNTVTNSLETKFKYNTRIYENEKPKDIKTFGKMFFDGDLGPKSGLYKYRIKYNYIDKFPPYDGVKVNGRSFFEYVDIPDLVTDFSYLGGKPIILKDYYSSIRSKNINNSLFYSFSNPYAIGNKSNMLSFYIEGKRTIGTYTEIKIEDGKGDNGNLLTKSTQNGPVSKYQELEGLNDSISDKGGVFIGDSGYSKLIHRTNDLFKNMKLGTLVNRFHTSSKELHDYTDDELVTANSDYGLSRGRNLLTKSPEYINGYFNPYCRVWTAHHQYTKLSRLIRPFSNKGGAISIADTQRFIENDTNLRPGNGGTEHLANHTVLMKNGFVRMSPAHDEEFYDTEKNANIKSFMFSIENLAWRDVNWDSARVSKEQQGPNGGRMMWFPPYNLKFSENVNVEWNSNKFIGRGELIYTYTNTDRSGTLSFTLLIDHPSIINKWRGTAKLVDYPEEREKQILRFFAGCEMLSDTVSPGTGTPSNQEITPSFANPKYNGRTRNIALILFFPNNFSGNDYRGSIDTAINKLRGYEYGSSWNNEQDRDLINTTLPNDNASNTFNLNTITSNDENAWYVKDMLFGGDEDVEFYGFFDQTYGYDRLNDVIKDIKSEQRTIFGDKHKDIEIEKIELYGFASSHGTPENNEKLEERRATFIKNALLNKCSELEESMFGEMKIAEKQVEDVSSNPNDRDINTITAKVARSAYALFRIRWSDDTTTNSGSFDLDNFIVQNQNYSSVPESGATEITPEVATITSESSEADTYRADNEYLYFANLERDDEVAYQKIIDRIRYFNPAFHSITPEGFNARLTFLHQCTRQGPTVDLSPGRHSASGSTNYTKYAGNLSFGRAPYCILRIGDFFHTKICITSLSIDYDGGAGIQWDLNPEGIGVQPMFANVNITFNFIGGQDLKGPIERLQNAVTSNYYANASVYDHKADKKGSGFPYDVRLNVPDKPDDLESQMAKPASSEEFARTIQQTPEQRLDRINSNSGMLFVPLNN